MKSVSLIGAGKNASEHTRALRSIENLEILGVCSKNFNSAENFKKINNLKYATTDIEDLFKKTKSKYLLISVPVNETFKVLESASKFPWKILVEKPLGLNLNEALVINKFLENKNPNTFVALNRRFYKIYKQIINLINFSKDKIEIEIYDYQSINNASNLNHNMDIIKNWHFANSIHLIDLGLFFSNSKVYKVLNNHKFDKNKTRIHSLIYLENDSIIKYYADWTNKGSWMIKLKINHVEVIIKPLEKVTIYHEAYCYSMSEFYFQPYNLYKPGYLNQALYFTDIKTDKEFELVNFKQSLTTMQLISKIYDF